MSMIRTAQYLGKKFFNENRNNTDFQTNTGEFSTNCNYNILQKGRFEGQVITSAYTSSLDIFYKQGTTNSLYNTLTDFSEFAEGDEIRIIMSWNGTEPEGADKAVIDLLELVDWTGTVVSGNQGTLYFTSPVIATSDDIRVINYLAKAKIFVKSVFTYTEYDYKFLENDGNEEVTSTLDGRIQRYSGAITGSFTELPFSVKNNNTGVLSVKFDGTTQSPVEGSGVWTDIAQLYTYRHDFIVDHYIDADQSNYRDGVPTEVFISDNNLDYYTKINLFREKGLDQGKQTFEVRHEGSTGFINENFNTAQRPYEAENVVVKRLSDGSVIDAVTTQFPVLVECDLKGDFSATNTFTIYHKSLLNNADYEFKDVLYTDLFNYESVRITSLGVPVSDTIIQNATITAFDASTVSVSYELHIPSTESGYVTGVNVEKDSFSSVGSDMTNVRVSSNEYQNTFDVDGLVSVDSYKVIPRNCNPLDDIGNTSMATVGDDIFFIKLEFSLDLTLDAFLEEFEIRSVIYNSSNKDIKILDTKNISLVNLVDVAGIQKINDNFSSGYTSLNPNINNAQFKYISDDGNTANYELIMPYRVPSQKHIASVDDLKDVGFYNPNIDENNGSNVDFYDKLANGYTQHVGIYFKVSGSEYTYLSPDLDIKNYQEEFDTELFNSEEIDIEVDGFDVDVVINNKDNEIITTVVSVNDLTGVDLINTLYLQPITGDKYSPFEVNSPLFSTDGFTHIYKGQLDKNTISSNQCLTSIVSTDDCEGENINDILSSAIFVGSNSQLVLGAPTHNGDINGQNITTFYNQVNQGAGADLVAVSGATAEVNLDGDFTFIGDSAAHFNATGGMLAGNDFTLTIKSTPRSSNNAYLSVTGSHDFCGVNYAPAQDGQLWTLAPDEFLGAIDHFYGIKKTVTLVYTANNTDVYVDGVFDVSIVTNDVYTDLSLRLGRSTKLDDFDFNHYIVNREALTSEQVIRLHEYLATL